ncbi:MAG: tRNA-dihydrouridine synthase [Candidatus Hodarchaeales archaeon]|jgi:TIM-barrel protein
MNLSPSHAVLAAMAGVTNGDFAALIFENGCVGKVTIGGYSIGKEMINAAVELTLRGRSEFPIQLGEEANFIVQELDKLPSNSNTIVNVRLNNPEETLSFAREFSERISVIPIIEVNAHCRQQEILEKGGGQNLTQRPETLSRILSIFKSKDFPTSLKIRGNTVDPRSFSKLVNDWGIDYLHIDSYRNGIEGTDLTLLTSFTSFNQSEVIGNNSVVDQRSAKAILDTGASYFSVARAARKNHDFFCSLVKDF